MAQRLVRYDGTPIDINDLSDVSITNPQDFDILVKTGGFWQNLNLSSAFVAAYTLKATIQVTHFSAQSNNIYIVDTTDGSINCILPTNPLLGDRLLFIDSKSNKINCSVGWGTNSLTLLPTLSTTIEAQASLVLDKDHDYKQYIFNSCDNWVDITGRSAYKTIDNKAADYTLEEWDLGYLITFDTTGGAITLTLPDVAFFSTGYNVQVVITTGTNAINLSSVSTINSVPGTSLTTQYQTYTITHTGGAWLVN